jgi:hypothetical protein
VPTDGIDQALVAAGITLLRADTSLVVCPGGVPKPIPNPPYVVVRSYVDWPAAAEGDSLDGVSGSPTVKWYCYCVGGGKDATPETASLAAIAVAERVRTALLNKRPTIAGLDLGIIRQDIGAGTPTPNETTGVFVMETVAIYRMLAVT